MPLNSLLARPDGGKSAGMRTTVVSMPRSSSRSQKARPFLSNSTRPAASGNCHFPTVTKWLGGTVLLVDRNGIIVFGSRWMKSKMR